MATVIQPPTRAQLAKFCGSDLKLILDFLQLFSVQGFFPGLIIYSAMPAVGGLLMVNGVAIAVPATGTAVSRLGYPNLLNAIVPISGVTISHASPAVVAWTANGLAANAPIYLATNGVLPSPLVAATEYFVKTPGTNSFTISATAGGAAINTTTDGSGDHTATAYPFGIGDGSTTFGVPTVAAVGGCNAFVVF